MTKYYTFIEPADDGVTPVYTTWTAEQILVFYWDYWKKAMDKKFGEGYYKTTKDNCVDDFVVAHWAWVSDEHGREINYPA